MASRRHASQRSAWAGAAAIAAACLFTLSTLPAAAQSPTDLSQTDLARAYQTIASKTFVDLTHSFGPDTPVWSGFGQAKFSPAADPKTHEPYTIAKDGFRTTYYEWSVMWHKLLQLLNLLQNCQLQGTHQGNE